MSIPIDANLPEETPDGTSEISSAPVPSQVDEDNVPVKDVGSQDSGAADAG